MNRFITCSTAALALALAAASLAHASPADSNSAQAAQAQNATGQASAMSNPAFSKQRVDGGDLQSDTIFQEKYQRQPVPSSK